MTRRISVLLAIWGMLGGVACISGKKHPDGGGDGAPGDGVVAADLPRHDGPKKGDGPWPDGPQKKVCNGLSKPGWARMEPGTFFMGARAGEACLESNETRHKVTLTHPFEISITEVTQAQHQALMTFDPTHPSDKNCGGSCPVGSASWNQAAAYCNALSTKEGKSLCYTCTGSNYTRQCEVDWKWNSGGKKIYHCPGYRLPTEAEWEYAYRAGTETAYYNGDGKASDCLDCSSGGLKAGAIAWYCGNSGSVLRPVKGKAPNACGIHDMAGNMKEWTDDWYLADLGKAQANDPWINSSGAKKEKVIRGGSYLSAPSRLRAAYRTSFEPSSSASSGRWNGFRCVRSLK